MISTLRVFECLKNSLADINPDSNYSETFKDNPSKACFTKSRHKSFKAFHKHALFFPWNYFQYVSTTSKFRGCAAVRGQRRRHNEDRGCYQIPIYCVYVLHIYGLKSFGQLSTEVERQNVNFLFTEHYLRCCCTVCADLNIAVRVLFRNSTLKISRYNYYYQLANTMYPFQKIK